jgi:hypothetical protein
MPSLLDYYQPPQQVQAFELGDIGTQRASAIATAAMGKGRLLSHFQDRTIPQQAATEAAAGRFSSGNAQQRATWAGQDVQEQGQDIELGLGNVLNELRRRTFYTNLGV